MFVSYGSGDIAIVEDILAPGITNAGASYFLDVAAITLGEDFRARIFDELFNVDEMLVLLTTTSVERPWVFIEIGAMIAMGKRIVALTYGPEDKLAPLGIDTALGTSLRGTINDRKRYFEELSDRVKKGTVA